MEVSKLQKKLHDLYEDNKIKNVFSTLKAELDAEGERISIFRNLKRRYNKITDQKMADTIDRGAYNLEMNQVLEALSSFIESLKTSDLGSKVEPSHAEISNQILVFTKEQEVENVSEFFRQLNFVNVKVKQNGEEVELSEFDLIVFDNSDLPVCYNRKSFAELEAEQRIIVEKRMEEMDFIINESSKFIIHFGGILFWVNAHRDRVQAANSKFSLYARTKEVIDFINTYRV